MSIAYIALGTNLGDKRRQMENALAALQQAGVTVRRVSPFIETEPYGVTDQPAFLNGVCEVETPLSPQELLAILLKIETQQGRVRTRHWGPRVIDLDLLLYDDQIIDEPNLQVPHPDMENRGFVLQPLAAIAPQVVHPKLGQTIERLWQALLARNEK